MATVRMHFFVDVNHVLARNTQDAALHKLLPSAVKRSVEFGDLISRVARAVGDSQSSPSDSSSTFEIESADLFGIEPEQTDSIWRCAVKQGYKLKCVACATTDGPLSSALTKLACKLTPTDTSVLVIVANDASQSSAIATALETGWNVELWCDPKSIAVETQTLMETHKAARFAVRDLGAFLGATRTIVGSAALRLHTGLNGLKDSADARADGRPSTSTAETSRTIWRGAKTQWPVGGDSGGLGDLSTWPLVSAAAAGPSLKVPTPHAAAGAAAADRASEMTSSAVDGHPRGQLQSQAWDQLGYARQQSRSHMPQQPQQPQPGSRRGSMNGVIGGVSSSNAMSFNADTTRHIPCRYKFNCAYGLACSFMHSDVEITYFQHKLSSNPNKFVNGANPARKCGQICWEGPGCERWLYRDRCNPEGTFCDFFHSNVDKWCSGCCTYGHLQGENCCQNPDVAQHMPGEHSHAGYASSSNAHPAGASAAHGSRPGSRRSSISNGGAKPQAIQYRPTSDVRCKYRLNCPHGLACVAQHTELEVLYFEKRAGSDLSHQNRADGGGYSKHGATGSNPSRKTTRCTEAARPPDGCTRFNKDRHDPEGTKCDFFHSDVDKWCMACCCYGHLASEKSCCASKATSSGYAHSAFGQPAAPAGQTTFHSQPHAQAGNDHHHFLHQQHLAAGDASIDASPMPGELNGGPVNAAAVAAGLRRAQASGRPPTAVSRAGTAPGPGAAAVSASTAGAVHNASSAERTRSNAGSVAGSTSHSRSSSAGKRFPDHSGPSNRQRAGETTNSSSKHGGAVSGAPQGSRDSLRLPSSNDAGESGSTCRFQLNCPSGLACERVHPNTERQYFQQKFSKNRPGFPKFPNGSNAERKTVPCKDLTTCWRWLQDGKRPEGTTCDFYHTSADKWCQSCCCYGHVKDECGRKSASQLHDRSGTPSQLNDRDAAGASASTVTNSEHSRGSSSASSEAFSTASAEGRATPLSGQGYGSSGLSWIATSAGVQTLPSGTSGSRAVAGVHHSAAGPPTSATAFSTSSNHGTGNPSDGRVLPPGFTSVNFKARVVTAHESSAPPAVEGIGAATQNGTAKLQPSSSRPLSRASHTSGTGKATSGTNLQSTR